MELAVISIIVLTPCVWLFNKMFKTNICLICGAVSGTWIWMLVAGASGYSIDPVIPAMLMGGSVVGINYQLEKKIKNREWLIYWRITFIILGFLTAYNLLMFRWINLAIYSAIAICLGFVAFGSKHQRDTKNIESIESSMKNCC